MRKLNEIIAISLVFLSTVGIIGTVFFYESGHAKKRQTIDLEARPIFHRLEETITAHLVIVFAGLAITRYLELKTNLSIKRILKIAGKVLTHKVTNTKTGEIAYVETTIEDPKLKEKINLLKSLGH